MKKLIKADTATNSKRVIQLSFDIVTDDTFDSDEIRRMIENYIDVAGGKHDNFRCAGSDFIGDLTSTYKKDYPYVLQ